MAEGNLVQIIIKAKQELSSELGKAEGALGSLSTKLSGLSAKFAIPTIALGALATGLAVIVKHAADFGDELLKVSDQTGITVEQLSALNYAGVQSDVTLTDMSEAVKKLSVNMAEAIQHSGETRDAFETGLQIPLGKLKEASGDSAKAFELMATQLVKVQSNTNRTNLQVKLFGKSSQQLTQFIDDLASRGLKGFQDAAEKAGVIIGRDFAVAADQFNDNLGKMKIFLRVLEVQIAGPLMTALINFAAKMRLVTLDAKELQKVNLVGQIQEFSGAIRELEEIKAGKRPGMVGGILDAILGEGPLIGKAPDPQRIQGMIDDNKAKLESLKTALAEVGKVQEPEEKLEGDLPDRTKKKVSELETAVKSLTRSLEEQLMTLAGEKIALEQGEDAALRFGIAQKIAMLPGKPSAGEQATFDALADKIAEASNQLVEFKENAERAKAAFEAIDQRDPYEVVDTTTQAFKDEVSKMVQVHREAQNTIAGFNNQIADVFLTNAEREKAAAQQWGDQMIFQLQKVKDQYRNEIPGIAGMVDDLIAKVPAAVASKLDTTEETIRDILGGITEGFSTMTRGIIQGTQTLQEAFANMATNIGLSLSDKIMARALDPILDKLSRIIAKLADAAIGGFLSGLGPGGGSMVELAAQGGIFRGGLTPIHGYAGGGVVRSPQLAFIGEGGRDEAVIPLRGGKVPVQMQGNAAPSVSVHVHGSITPNPGIDPARVIEIVTSDYRADGRTRRMMRG